MITAKEIMTRFKHFAYSKGYTYKVIGDYSYSKGYTSKKFIRLHSAKNGIIKVYETGRGIYTI